MSRLNLIRVERTRPVRNDKDELVEESFIEYKTYRKETWGPTGKGGVYCHGDKAFYHYEGAQIERNLYASRSYYGSDPWTWVLENDKGTFSGEERSQEEVIRAIDKAISGDTKNDEDRARERVIEKAEDMAREEREDAEDEYLEKLETFTDHDMLWLAQRILNGLNSDQIKNFVNDSAKRWNTPGATVVVEGMKYVVEDKARKSHTERFVHLTGG